MKVKYFTKQNLYIVCQYVCLCLHLNIIFLGAKAPLGLVRVSKWQKVWIVRPHPVCSSENIVRPHPVCSSENIVRPLLVCLSGEKKYAVQVCMYAFMQVCKYASMQV